MSDIYAKSLKEAKELGEKYYILEKPCKNGVIAPRKVNGTSSVCTCDICWETHVQYHRKKGARKRANAEYREKAKKFVAQWRKDNPEKLKEGQKRYYEENKEEIMRKTRNWKKENNYKNSPEVVTRAAHKRRSRKRECRPEWYSEFDEFVLDQCVEIRQLRRDSTNIEWHIDHIFPIQNKKVCGLDVGLNLQVIPAALNIRKKNRLMYTNASEWIWDL